MKGLSGIFGWSDFSLKKRLIHAFLTILFLLAVANFVLILLFTSYIRQYNAMMESIALTNSISGILKVELDSEMRDIAYGKVAFSEGTQYELLIKMNRYLDQIMEKDVQGRLDYEIDEVRKLLFTVTEYIDKLGRQIKNKASADERNITYEYITISTNLIEDQVQQLLKVTLNESGKTKSQITDQLSRDVLLYFSAFIIIIVLSVLFGWYISHTISKPLHRLALNANRIANGDLTVQPLNITGNNEIADLCRAYNRMFMNLKEIILTVSNTNELVLVSYQDIHQGIQDNRLAGEEIATATQSISLTLHIQDELIRLTSAYFDELSIKHNQLTLQMNHVNRHTDEVFNLANNGYAKLVESTEYLQGIKLAIQDVFEEFEQFRKLEMEVAEHLKLNKLISRETNILCQEIITEAKIVDQQLDFTDYTERTRRLAEEARQIEFTTEEKMNWILEKIDKIRKKTVLVSTEIDKGHLQMEQNKRDYEFYLQLNHVINIEGVNVAASMAGILEQMNYIQTKITMVEEHSKMNMSDLENIAIMEEEQLATLEEVAEASTAVVNRIQKMKNSITKFDV